jgi:hypothetical protein
MGLQRPPLCLGGALESCLGICDCGELVFPVPKRPCGLQELRRRALNEQIFGPISISATAEGGCLHGNGLCVVAISTQYIALLLTNAALFAFVQATDPNEALRLTGAPRVLLKRPLN